ncbi:MAG TPA: hypothetical protein VFU02_17095 [Polyangiaceae bacterium]|nr:hypothetical protein [Polyangiaceae bacterium]
MRRLLVPAEARDSTPVPSPTDHPLVLTPEGVTLASLLAVTLPVTAALSFMLVPVVLPTTGLVAYAFWHHGRRVTQVGTMIVYCFAAGALAGALNSCLTLLLWGLFVGGSLFRHMGAAFGSALLLGAGVGIAHGTAYLLPMLVQLSARSLRRVEGVDRCLISHGSWGVVVLGLAIAAASAVADVREDWLVPVLVVTFACAGLHAAMLVVGTLRSARRRAWLARVVRGKVPGWLVCEQHQFAPAELEGLELFCKPLFAPASASEYRVLARRGKTGPRNAYRTAPITAKFLIA